MQIKCISVFSSSHKTYTQREHILYHKTHLPNLKTVKVSKNINISFRKPKNELSEYEIAKKQFEEILEEAEDDVRNGRLVTYEEVIKGELKLVESKIPELSEEEQIEAKKFLEYLKEDIID